MTKKQQKAIDRLNKSLEKLHESGVFICGMDDDLLFATKKAINKTPTYEFSYRGEYPDVAQALREFENDENMWNDVGTLYSKGYCGSGGW